MRASARNKSERGLNSHKYGHFSEKIVCFYLMLKGYRIISRNFKNNLGEIDIIAAKHRRLAIIEVKARKSKHYEVLNSKQQKRIINGASLFIAKHPQFKDFEIRFDLVIFKPFSINHVIDCWRP